MRVAVVGAGVVGLSIARALLAAGHEVTVYDQGRVPNPLGSSVDRSRLIRHTYGRQLGYAAMVDDAYAAWDRLWAEMGESLYVRTGTLLLDYGEGGWPRDCVATLARIGKSWEALDRKAAEERFPLLDLSGIAQACFVPTGGVLHAEKIVAALARRVRELGGTLCEETRVAEVDAAASAAVLADRGRVEGDLLVLAPGPWVNRLLPDLAERLTPSRQVVCYAEIPADRRERWSTMPMVLDIGPESGFYVVPPHFGAPLKIGDHSFSLRGDPARDREAGAAELNRLFESASSRLKEFPRYRLRDGRTCFYTVEPQERFVVEPRGKAFVFAGFSGHGFKFGPLIGERFAEVVAGRRSVEAFIRWAEGCEA